MTTGELLQARMQGASKVWLPIEDILTLILESHCYHRYIGPGIFYYHGIRLEPSPFFCPNCGAEAEIQKYRCTYCGSLH